MHKQADELQITSDFVAANADKFKLPVFGPIACEVQAQDQQVAAYLEQAVDKRFWRQYVVQCQADYDVLHRNTPASVSVYAGNPDAPMNGQIPQGLLDDLAEFGVTGTLDRAFEAPPVIKRVLCDNSGLQRHVVGTQRTALKARWRDASPQDQIERLICIGGCVCTKRM